MTVTFSVAAPFPDIRIAEYQGLATSTPVDVVAAAQGSSATSSSGAVSTTNPNDLLVGANLVQTGTTAAGTSFTSRGITVPDGDILEDRVVAAVGSYSATAPVSPAGSWIMQMVAFRAAGSVDRHRRAIRPGQPRRDGDLGKPDQPDLDGRDRQRRRHRLSRRAMPGRRVHDFRRDCGAGRRRRPPSATPA